jgi:gas vesicle protein
MNTGKVALALIGGASIGAIIGILFAPAKGKVTRRAIVRKGERQVNEMKDRYNEFVDSVSEKFEQVKEEVIDFAEEAMSKAQVLETEVKDFKVK